MKFLMLRAVGQEGVGHNGVGHNGVGQDGLGQDGVGQDGVGQDGVGQDVNQKEMKFLMWGAVGHLVKLGQDVKPKPGLNQMYFHCFRVFLKQDLDQ